MAGLGDVGDVRTVRQVCQARMGTRLHLAGLHNGRLVAAPMTRGERVAAAALAWLDTPFVNGQRDRNGIDCAGLVILSARAAGIPVEDVPPYDAEDGPRLLRAHLARYCDPMTGEQEAGDVLLFHLQEEDTHLGIVTRPGWFVQAWARPSVQRVVESQWHRYWERSFVGAWRWREDW